MAANRNLCAGVGGVAVAAAGFCQAVGASVLVSICFGAVTLLAAVAVLCFHVLERRAADTEADPVVESRIVPRANLDKPMKFVNRKEELTQLDELLKRVERGEGPLVAVLGGLPGVGKSAVGKHWASLVRERFSDGDLVADFSQRRRGVAVDVSGFLADFIRKLGPPGALVPPTLAERVERFQSMTFDRKLLILLDDVSRATEVSQLQPTGKESLVLATSYADFENLHYGGVEFVPIDPLTPNRAEDLLVEMAGRFGSEFSAHPARTRKLIEFCGGLALPLCVCASRLLLGRGRLTVSSILADVADEQRRLDYLAGKGDYAGAAVFGFAYADLPRSQRLTYRRIGLHPGPDISPVHAALLTGLSLDDAQKELAALAGTHLLGPGPGGRYRFHDLVRLHAREAAEREESAEKREALFGKLVGWYHASLRKADWTLITERLRLAPAEPISVPDLPDFSDQEGAFEWLENERANILTLLEEARDRELDEEVWQMVESLWLFHYNHRHYADWIDATRIGIESARRAENSDAEARLRTQLAWALVELRRFDGAWAELVQANRIVRSSENLQLQGSVREFTGAYYLKKGEYDQAIAAFEEAREIGVIVDSNRGVALQDYFIGWALIEKGEYEDALGPLTESLERMRKAEDKMFVGRLLLRLGQAQRGSGSMDEAETTLAEGMKVLRSLKMKIEEAETYDELAVLAEVRGRRAAADAQRERAQAIYRKLGHPRAGEFAPPVSDPDTLPL